METLAFGHACCMSKSIFSNMKCNLKSLEVDVVISALEKNLLEAEVHLGFRTVLSMCTQTRRVYSWTLETCLLSISRGFSEHFLQVCLLLCSVGSWRLVWCVCVEGRGPLSGAVVLLTLCVSRDQAQAPASWQVFLITLPPIHWLIDFLYKTLKIYKILVLLNICFIIVWYFRVIFAAP